MHILLCVNHMVDESRKELWMSMRQRMKQYIERWMKQLLYTECLSILSQWDYDDLHSCRVSQWHLVIRECRLYSLQVWCDIVTWYPTHSPDNIWSIKFKCACWIQQKIYCTQWIYCGNHTGFLLSKRKKLAHLNWILDSYKIVSHSSHVGE